MSLENQTAELAARLWSELQAARAAEADAIQSATREHASMPANYWQERYRLEQRLRTAMLILEALKEEPYAY